MSPALGSVLTYVLRSATTSFVIEALCFVRVDHMQALKYMILKTQVKMYGDILKFARSHELYKILRA